MTFVQAAGISKAFDGSGAVDNATISVGRGEALALLGPSGCGKTTLLRILAGLETADGGVVSVDGSVLTGPGVFVPPEERRIGMVFHDWALFPHMTVAKNVAFGLTRREIDGGRVSEVLEMVGLADLVDRYPDELSGGQAQRVALARALAPRPRVLLFDEPFSSLDRELRVQVRSDVAALMRQVGMTSIFVTHDQEEAFILGTRVAVMRHGRIVQTGEPSEVYEYPVSPWVATFVGEANVFGGEAANGTMASPVGLLPLAEEINGACEAVVRPEHLLLGNGDDGVVSAVEFYGHDSSYQVAVNGTSLLVRGIAAPRFRPGDKVSVTYSGPRVMVFPAEPQR
jgi:iron(III) transport system ATP-binding protein